VVVDQFQALTDYASVVNRLAAFEESCESAASEPSDDGRRIEVVEDHARVALENVTLATPDWARVLQHHISFAVAGGDRLLLSGLYAGWHETGDCLCGSNSNQPLPRFMLPSAKLTALAPTRTVISGLDHTARPFAVYASQGWVAPPQRKTPLSDGWPAFPGGANYPLDRPTKGFRSSQPPFPRCARDAVGWCVESAAKVASLVYLVTVVYKIGNCLQT
jgi:hypothetical protein